MKFAEQIRALETTRAAKAAAMEQLMSKASDAGTGLDDAQGEEFDNLDVEIKAIDADLVRLRRLESINVGKAQPVRAVPGTDDQAAPVTRGPTIIVPKQDRDDKFLGQSYTRMVIAKALAWMERQQGNITSPSQIAQQRWGKTNPTLVQVIKANEVGAGGETTSNWGAELAQADSRFTGDFINFLYAMTVFDRLPLRAIPANVIIKGQDGQATGFWVGEGKAIPASTGDFSTVTLTRLKVAAISSITKELIKDSTPEAEALVQAALGEASAQRVDTTFFSTSAATSGVTPAGILNGVTGKTSLGSDDFGVRADVGALYQDFITAHNSANLVFVCNTGLAKKIGLITNALGQLAFPGIGTMGGTLLGDPLYTGDNVTPTNFILMKPTDIYKIGDTGLEVSVSDSVTLEMSSVPTGSDLASGGTPTAASANLQNMFQQDSIAIKIVRPINFAKRRSTAVSYISNAAYSPQISG